MGHPTMRSLDLSRNRVGITGAQVREQAATGRPSSRNIFAGFGRTRLELYVSVRKRQDGVELQANLLPVGVGMCYCLGNLFIHREISELTPITHVPPHEQH